MNAIAQQVCPRNLAPSLTKLWHLISRQWGRLQRRSDRQLRLRESLALGERRSVSVVEFGSRKLLLGSAGSSLTMLAMFEETRSGADVPTWQFENRNLVRCA